MEHPYSSGHTQPPNNCCLDKIHKLILLQKSIKVDLTPQQILISNKLHHYITQALFTCRKYTETTNKREKGALIILYGPILFF